MAKWLNRLMIVLLFIPLIIIGIIDDFIGARERRKRPGMED